MIEAKKKEYQYVIGKDYTSKTAISISSERKYLVIISWWGGVD